MRKASPTYCRRFLWKPWILLLLVPLLQSCLVVKPYERPELELQNLYRNFNNNDTTTLAAIPWPELFSDPHLRNLIETGLQNNLELATAYQNILIAEADFRQGRAAFLPSLDINGNASSSELAENSIMGRQFRGNDDNNGPPPGRVQQYELLGNLSWEADIWGRIRSLREARAAALQQNQAAYRAVQTRLVANIASAYYRLLALDAQLRIAEQTVETRQNSLITITKLQRAGNETALAIKQQEAQIYTARILQVDLKQQIAQLENRVSTLLAVPPGPVARGSLQEQLQEVPIAAGVPSQLLRNRPDVLEAEYALISAFELTNVARADFYPRLALSAEAGFQSLNFSSWISSASLYNSIAAGLTAPIFRRRQLRTNYEINQAQQQQALLNFESTLRTAGREVSDALVTYQAESEKYELREKQVETLTTAEDYANKLLVNGYANYLEVLRATDEKLAAQLELVNTQYNQMDALVTLYRALGGGWSREE
ncbi:TolC family protein [Pontibacter diazotrophicus]|uniref:TolC family protein n=1 Tax=Pontibacter diazotrophicus TaxID=1400979 RepID=A0A3D8LGJ6_9BACT|nr:TolC family protein [Pontibacter diazotrophicus]RDV16561.1 TolC family protein [Pontibacter diazotrophicus]